MRPTLASMVLPLLMGACGDKPTTDTITSIQAACVDGDEVRVWFAGCLSSSCDTLTSATCDAVDEGGVLRVTGTAEVTTQGTVCTDDCGFIVTTCAIPGDPDPTTTILTFGGDDGGPVLEDAGCDGEF